MADDLDLDDSDVDDDNDIDTIRNLKSQLRDQKRREKELVAKAEANSEAMKKLAFIEAKLPDGPQVKFFLDHYDGDFTAEAIRAAAAENGFITVDKETQDEVDQVQRMMEANSGANSLASPGSDKELMDRINAVKPGPNASAQIRDIMAAAGRWESDE